MLSTKSLLSLPQRGLRLEAPSPLFGGHQEQSPDSDLSLSDWTSLVILLKEESSCSLGVNKHPIGIPDDFFLLLCGRNFDPSNHIKPL